MVVPFNHHPAIRFGFPLSTNHFGIPTFIETPIYNRKTHKHGDFNINQLVPKDLCRLTETLLAEAA